MDPSDVYRRKILPDLGIRKGSICFRYLNSLAFLLGLEKPGRLLPCRSALGFPWRRRNSHLWGGLDRPGLCKLDRVPLDP